MPRTRRVDCSDPGIRRVRRGRGFSYLDHEGDRISDRETIERIRSLAVPPAWTDVWICPDPRGHIQATGFDAAGRKQYRYHDDWRVHRDRQKFELMLDFGAKLPRLREGIQEQLELRGLSFERVVACSVALLDLGLFRVGSTRYEDEHGTYGLTTLKLRHVSIDSGAALFSYRSKSGQRTRHRISDSVLVRVIRSLMRRQGAKPGSNLLGFREGRDWRELTSEQVNTWIAEMVGEPFSAKDFRTWNATVLAAVFLAEHAESGSSSSRKRGIEREVVGRVAEQLHNTPAVCRSSYIDPRLFDRFDSGQTIAPTIRRLGDHADLSSPENRATIERAVLRLLRR